MKQKFYLFLIALMASVGAWAQADDASAISGAVVSRAPEPAGGFEAPIRRAAARRKALAASWSYPGSTPAAPFAGGSGTEADPYQIATAQQLANMAYLVNTNSSYRSLCYELTADIVLNEDILDEERQLKTVGTQWTPIGGSGYAFTGHFNGNGHSVKGMYIYTTTRYTGLFAYISGATIENLGMEDGYVYGCCMTGSVAGYAYNATIQNCFNTNTMYSRGSCLGGVVGETNGTTRIVACYNSGSIHNYGQACSHGYNGNDVGGVAGAIGSGGSISYSCNTGSVYGGAYYASGVCAPLNHDGPTATNCYNYGRVSCYNSNSTGHIVAASGGYSFSISPSCSNCYGLSLASPVHLYSTEKSDVEFADGTVLQLLDSEGAYFKQGEKYPVLKYVDEGKEPEVVIEAEGQCGEDAWWRLTDAGELIITGTGPMFDYGVEAVGYIQKAGPRTILMGIQMYGIDKFIAQVKAAIEQDATSLGLAPWVNYSSKIRKITVEKGITTIAQGAFLLLTSATEASIPSTIESVGSGAFAFCTTLANLYSYAVVPPAMVGALSDYTFCCTANTNAANYNNPSLCTLHVSTISKADYAVADGWKLFTNVTNELEPDWDPTLSLTDENTYLLPETYKPGNLTYTLTAIQPAEGSYASFCLPFDVDLAVADCFTAAYAPLDFVFFSEKTGQLNLFFREQTGVVPAGTPFLAQLNGKEVKLANCAETTLTEGMSGTPKSLYVLRSTSVGGIMQPSGTVDVQWDGTFASAERPDMRIFNLDGTLSEATVAPAFRTLITIAGPGIADVKGINAIRPAADDPSDDPTDPSGDPADGEKVKVKDITELIEKYLSQSDDDPQPADEHEWVDLGLSVKWATMNVGANAPEEYGDYFAWGEVEPKEEYNWETYKWCEGTATTLTKYNINSSYGTVDNKSILDPEDDAAHVYWGGDWRMPTQEEQDELYSKCTWTWTTQNGVNGYTVVGPNGSSIFLPAAGVRYNASLGNVDTDGYYWPGSLGSNDQSRCRYLSLSSLKPDLNYYIWRSYGLTVRPVCP